MRPQTMTRTVVTAVFLTILMFSFSPPVWAAYNHWLGQSDANWGYHWKWSDVGLGDNTDTSLYPTEDRGLKDPPGICTPDDTDGYNPTEIQAVPTASDDVEWANTGYAIVTGTQDYIEGYSGDTPPPNRDGYYTTTVAEMNTITDGLIRLEDGGMFYAHQGGTLVDLKVSGNTMLKVDDGYTLTTTDMSLADGTLLDLNDGTLTGTLAVTNTINPSTDKYGTINFNSGNFTFPSAYLATFNANADYALGGNLYVNNLTIASGKTLTQNSTTLEVSNNINSSQEGTFTYNGGTLGFANAYLDTLNINSSLALPGNVYANTLNIDSGATLDTGANTLNADIYAKSGTTLKGEGAVTGAVTIEDGAIISPGGSPGLLSIDGNFDLAGTYVIEIDGYDQGVTYDFITATGTATLASTAIFDFSVSITPIVNDTFTFLHADGGITDNGVTFTGLDLGTWEVTLSGDGKDYFAKFNGEEPEVPEPSTIIMSILGFFPVAFRWIRRRMTK